MMNIQETNHIKGIKIRLVNKTDDFDRQNLLRYCTDDSEETVLFDSVLSN